jgi:hypothetical protein
MTYKGVDYQYAFEFKVPVDYAPDPISFRIVIGDLKPKGFTGLCLDNEFTFISNEKLPFLAFFEIVSNIVNFTIVCGKNSTPLLSVTDEKFLKQFAEKRKNARSLEQYRQLKKNFEMLGTKLKDTPLEEKQVICDSPTMWFFTDLIRKENPLLSDGLYFRG